MDIFFRQDEAIQLQIFYKFKKQNCEIIADTAVGLQQKIHQLNSGTIITTHCKKTKEVKIEDEVFNEALRVYLIIDETKAKYIRDNYSNKKKNVFNKSNKMK